MKIKQWDVRDEDFYPSDRQKLNNIHIGIKKEWSVSKQRVICDNAIIIHLSF